MRKNIHLNEPALLREAPTKMSALLQGASKKMSDSDFSLKSVPGVGFYFFRGVSESEV